MDVVITLPRHLIDAISDGRKKIEIRKAKPIDFSPTVNKIYVCEKGTGLVKICFTVNQFVRVWHTDDFWESYGKLLCIPKSWYDKYTENRKNIYAWVIKEVWCFKKPTGLYECLGVPYAPQSFTYVKI